MKDIKAVIFDLDNTLINRTSAFKNYCISFIKECFQNRELPDSIDTMIEYMVSLDNNGYRSSFKFYNSLIEKWGLNDCTEQQFMDGYSDKFGKFTVMYDDTQSVLDYLAPKYKLGIITNGSSKTQNAKINYAGIRNCFDSIILSGEVGIQKPDKQIFIMSCNSLNVEANEAVYIGDHYENDIAGAENAGLHAVWYIHESDNPQTFENTITSLSDIMDFL